LIIGGSVKGSDDYWHQVRQTIRLTDVGPLVIQRIEFIPDSQIECFFKAADLLILPYTSIFQSGLLALGYNFGLPVVAADVGSLKEDIVEGETGFVCRPEDSTDLARAIQKYFDSDLYRQLAERRSSIRAYAEDRLSWTKIARTTKAVYSQIRC
jgi:glycosyltransferase involved in cell wall biosynthesis